MSGGSTRGINVKASLLAAERRDDHFPTTFNILPTKSLTVTAGPFT